MSIWAAVNRNCLQSNDDDDDYVNCYRFNANGSMFIGKSGTGYGLQLEIFVGNSSSEESFIHKRGLRYLVYNYTVNSASIYLVEF
jgi:hypothetical protein